MTSVQDIYNELCAWAPMETMEPWDNCGFQIGDLAWPVQQVLLSLDITPAVIAEAQAQGAQLIVSHHPMIWKKMGSITQESLQGRKAMALLQSGIAAICMHTNLDKAAGGVDDCLRDALGLQPVDILAPGPVGRIGLLPEALPLERFLAQVKDSLGSNGLRYVSGGRSVQRVATGCGACGDYIQAAAAAGCDTFVTSDLKYSDFLDGQALGLNLIDAGHFPTENPIVAAIQQRLGRAFPALQVRISQAMAQPDQFYV